MRALRSTCSVTPPNSDPERPNAIRRFFSWVIEGITRPFRRRPQFPCRLPPTVSIRASTSSITLPCPGNMATSAASCPSANEVTLMASSNAEGDQILFTWAVTAGRLRGEGRLVTWDLSGVPLGTYTATVEVNAGNQLTANASTSVTASLCTHCEAPRPACPALRVR